MSDAPTNNGNYSRHPLKAVRVLAGKTAKLFATHFTAICALASTVGSLAAAIVAYLALDVSKSATRIADNTLEISRDATRIAHNSLRITSDNSSREARFQQIQMMPVIRLEVDPAKYEIDLVNNGSGIGDVYEFFMLMGEMRHVVKNDETDITGIRDRGREFLRWATSVPETSFRGKFDHRHFSFTVPRGSVMPGQRLTVLRFDPLEGEDADTFSQTFLEFTDAILTGVCFTNMYGNLAGRYTWGSAALSHECDKPPMHPLGISWSNSK